MMALANLHHLLAAVGARHFEVMRIEEAADARQHLDLACLGHAGQAAGELLDHAVLECAQLVEVDLGRAVPDAVVGQELHLVHHRSGVQQRLATGCSRRSGTRRRAWGSARPARSSCRGRRCGRRPSSRPARRRARASRTRCRPCRRSGRRRAMVRTAAWQAPVAAAGAGAGTGAGAAAAVPVASTTRITEPSLTLSLTLTLMSFTTPACVDGISIEALSDSTMISPVSTAIVSPGLTITSITATSLKSPMSGTLTSTSWAMAANPSIRTARAAGRRARWRNAR